MLLEDWTYIEELIHHYSKDNKREPRIQLFAHNKRTYKKVCRMMNQNKGIAVVQATGTGKSYLIARLLQDFEGKRRLVMAPSYYIIEQIKEHIRWETDLPGEVSKIEFMTYARSMNLTAAEINALKPEMIVLDEFHRCGAEEWGRGVQNILSSYPKAFRLGTSATPVRYLDNGRDMSAELFHGQVAENLNLAQAIVRNILPMPKYVSALYTLSEEIRNMKERIAGSRKNEETKRRMLLDLDTVHIDWERSRGIPHVLKKHLRKNMRKFLIFCRDEAHLNEMEPIVRKWFKGAMDDIPVKTYRVHIKEAERDEHLEAFKSDLSKDYLHLLFSIDMLNEGLHVNEVNGVMLLRPTESPNIFYQQIGRCLKVGMNHQPVIFDFVNNFKSIRTHDFLYDLDFARKELLDRRKEEGLEDRCPRFNVNDEVREITEVFGEIEFKLETWNEMYERLARYHKRFGHSNVPDAWVEDPSLSLWLARQRKKLYYGHLEEDQKQKLDELNVRFNFRPLPTPVDWEQRFNELREYKNKNRHIEVMPKENRKLNTWMLRQRSKYKEGELTEDQIKKLNSIGFVWDIGNSKYFERKFIEMQEFLQEHHHLDFPYKNPLYAWAQHLRMRFREGALAEQQIQRLKAIGFDLALKEKNADIRNKRFEELKKFYKLHRHIDVAYDDKAFPGMAEWLRSIQETKKRWNFIEGNHCFFDDLGMDWQNNYLDRQWNKMYDRLYAYYEKTGTSPHSQV